MPDIRYRVLLADTLDESGLEVLRRGGCELIDATSEERFRLKDRITGCHGLVVRSRTKVDRKLLAAAGELRVIGCSGIGVDNVDLEAATEFDVAVINTPTANVVAATELTMALILALARNLSAAATSLIGGEWERRRFRGFELAGKTLGVIGFGRIGRQVAARCSAFGMAVMATDPYLEPSVARRFDAKFLPLDELLAEADVVTIHTPLSSETRHLIDARRLGRMKPGALLINCARGGVVDEQAVLEALDAGLLAGVGIDVHEHEPPVDLRLVRHPRVLATPHIGAQTEEAQRRVAVEVAERLVAVLEGSSAVDTVNLSKRSLDRRTRALLRLTRRLGALSAVLLSGGERSASPGLDLRIESNEIDEGLGPRLATWALAGALAVVTGDEVGEREAGGLGARERISAEHRSVPVLRGGVIRVLGGTDERSIGVAGTLDEAGTPILTSTAGAAARATLAGPLLIVELGGGPPPLARLLAELERDGCEVMAFSTCLAKSAPGRWLILGLNKNPSASAMRTIASVAGVLSVTALPFGDVQESGKHLEE